MIDLRRGAEDYLTLRRGLGFKLKRHGRFVREFVSFLESCGENRIMARRALQWATQPQNLQSAEWAARLSAIRGFARYWNAIDGTSEIPPEGLLPFRPRRRAPYLYSNTEIEELLKAAKSMPAQFKLQPFTYYCLLGLLTVTGLRISEALNLESRDIHWAESLLTIRTSKFGKSRLVPLDRTTKEVLAEYATRRNHIFPDRPTAVFFPSRMGTRLDPGQVRRVFYYLSRQVGIRGASESREPRLHDFRQHADFPIMPTWHSKPAQAQMGFGVLTLFPRARLQLHRPVASSP